MGMMAFGILFTPVCATMCSVTMNVAGDFNATSCNASSQIFGQSGIGSSVHFMLIPIGLLFFISFYVIPDGFILSPYRPPRFYA